MEINLTSPTTPNARRCRLAALNNRPARGCCTNSSDSDANPCSSTRLPCAARNEPRSTEMTSEIDDPSVETDSCDSLALGGRGHPQHH